ncbi:hypothetical protein AMTRI_Chr11g158710 [Amborella trichopoda]
MYSDLIATQAILAMYSDLMAETRGHIYYVICCSIGREEEARCLKRSDLMETLAHALPLDAIRFNCRAIDVQISPNSFPIFHLDDGTTIYSKVVVGCDGVNSIVAESLGFRAPSFDSMGRIRGVTTYPGKGHDFGNKSSRVTSTQIVLGRIPINHNLVHWFITYSRFSVQKKKFSPRMRHLMATYYYDLVLPKVNGVILYNPISLGDFEISKDPVLIRKAAMEAGADFPEEIITMVKNCDLSSLSLTQYRFRHPPELLLSKWHKGTGCSVGLKDAIVLGRCVGLAIRESREEIERQAREAICLAMEKYVKKRKMRVLRMASQTYLIGLLVKASSPLMKVFLQNMMLVLFESERTDTTYDCGTLFTPILEIIKTKKAIKIFVNFK